MSQKASPLVKVNCHHSGVFKKKGDNLEFVDGELVVLEVDSGCVFTSLMSKLIERRIVIGKMRFKLPYESLEDCKPLWEKVEFNKKKGLKPVNGPKFWEETGGGRILAPPYKRPPGRPKGKARIKGVHESPSKKKVGRQGREGHCGLCGGKGHNSRKCPHEVLAVTFMFSQSQEDRAKRRRLNEEAQLEGEVQAQLQAQEEANDEAQEAAEMEADFMAQLGEDEAHEEAEVQDVSSTAPQPTQVLRRSSRLASLLF
ncbi:hypothetical protein IGI04_019013, partial [Brassica rapa subsp. trilocularis]